MPHRFCTLPYMQQLKKYPAGAFLFHYPQRPPGPGTPPRQDAGVLSRQKQGIGRGLCTQSYRADSSGDLGCPRAFVLSPILGECLQHLARNGNPLPGSFFSAGKRITLPRESTLGARHGRVARRRACPGRPRSIGKPLLRFLRQSGGMPRRRSCAPCARQRTDGAAR